MDKRTRQFLDHAASARLSDRERSAVRENITAFMSRNPVTEDADLRQQEVMALEQMITRDGVSLQKDEKDLVRQRLTVFIREHDQFVVRQSFAETIRIGIIGFFSSIIPRTAFIALLCILMSTGVSYAAESSVPGDWLYGFKLYVSEPIAGRFMFDEASQAEWQTSLAIKRLAEAEELAARNQLTDDAWSDLQGRFLTHIDHAKRFIGTVGEKDAERALRLSKLLESSLHTRSASSITRFGTDGIGGTQIERVMRGVDAAATGLQQVRAGVEQRLEERIVEQQNDMQRSNAQEVITAAASRIDELRAALPLQRGPSPARDKLVQAEASIGTASSQLSGGAFDLAQVSARAAAQYAQEGLALLESEY